MKNLFLIALVLPFLAWVSPDQNLSGINDAFQRGDAKSLAQYFDSRVDIAILEQEDTYDKQGAERIITDFFSKNKPQSYKSVHQGVSKNADSQYSIGDLITASGAYRVYVYMKVDGSNHTIMEIRFDKK